jgi:Zn-dependent protease with chaperone function
MSTPRTGAYVIRPKEISPSWVLLYAATFALQLPCASFRGIVVYPILVAFFWMFRNFTSVGVEHIHTMALIVAYAPLAISLLTLILPLDGWWWEQRAGGRSPSEREQLIYEDAIAQLRQADPALREPRRWFVLDEEYESAAAYADTLMITRGLLESGYLASVIAHELGHLNTSDGRVSAALQRLTTPPRTEVRRGLKTICFLATGAAGMWVLRGSWGSYWRYREHEADHYAAKLGQAGALSAFLDERVLYDLPVPFRWLTEHSHPPTEHRIDQLAHYPT